MKAGASGVVPARVQKRHLDHALDSGSGLYCARGCAKCFAGSLLRTDPQAKAQKATAVAEFAAATVRPDSYWQTGSLAAAVVLAQSAANDP